MDELKTLETLGLTLPSPAYLIGAILFGVIGYIAYRHGKRNNLVSTKWIGVVLMLYPYAISDTWLLYVVGAVLSLALVLWRR